MSVRDGAQPHLLLLSGSVSVRLTDTQTKRHHRPQMCYDGWVRSRWGGQGKELILLRTSERASF